MCEYNRKSILINGLIINSRIFLNGNLISNSKKKNHNIKAQENILR